MSLSWRACTVLLFCSVFAFAQQPASQGTSAQSQAGPIQVDVVVAAARQGAPVSGLEEGDFTILDNKKPQNIVSFQAIDGAAPAAARQVEVILLLDLVNSSFEQAAIAQQQMVKYLEQNGGHLSYPTSIAIFSPKDGLRIQPNPSTDGNHLAVQLNATVREVGPTPVSKGEVERFQSSLTTLLAIAGNKGKSPARKVLIWTGPGWPMLAGSRYTSTSQDRQRDFDAIVAVSTALREAHISLYSISSTSQTRLSTPGAPPGAPMPMMPEAPQQPRVATNMSAPVEGTSYKEYLKAVKSSRQADAGYLALQVRAVQSGGRVLDPTNDLAGQIASCVEDLSPFYRISFAPPHADHPDDYHDLKVEIAKPGLTARTTSGFYNQP
jgi:VWFA-related protein